MHNPVPLEKVKNILVVIFKYHGDVLLTSPLYSALQEAAPHANIDVYLFKDTADMLLGHPAIREIFLYDRKWKDLSFWKKMKREAANLKSIRQRNYDLVINMTRGDRGAIVTRVTKAPYRVGYETDKGMVGQSHCYTHLVKWTRTPRHIVERNLDLLRVIGIHPPEEVKGLFFHVPVAERTQVREELERRGILGNKFALMHPASRVQYKNWPPVKFASLAQKFIKEGFRVVLSGGPGSEEREFVNEILHHLGTDRNLVDDLVGQFSLKGLGALIDQAEIVVTVDSVPGHLAAALQAKTVVLFGPSCQETWGPWKNDHAVIVSMPLSCIGCDDEGCGGSWMSHCLQELPINQVWHTCKRLIYGNADTSTLDLPA